MLFAGSGRTLAHCMRRERYGASQRGPSRKRVERDGCAPPRLHFTQCGRKHDCRCCCKVAIRPVRCCARKVQQMNSQVKDRSVTRCDAAYCQQFGCLARPKNLRREVGRGSGTRSTRQARGFAARPSRSDLAARLRRELVPSGVSARGPLRGMLPRRAPPARAP